MECDGWYEIVRSFLFKQHGESYTLSSNESLDVCSILLARASPIDWHTHNQGTQKDGLMKKGLQRIILDFYHIYYHDYYHRFIYDYN